MKTLMAPFLFSFLIVAGLPQAAWSQNNQRPARPGTINYVEGQASIGPEALSANSIGSAELGAGQTLTTRTGKVEILLAPGVFFRLDDNSSVKMISPDLANTEIALDRGRAQVEVVAIRKENNIRVDVNGAAARLLKKGLYGFDADRGQVRVFKGEAELDAANRRIKIKGNRQVTLGGASPLEARKFEPREYEDDFYRWSALRSGYLSEASADAARAYIGVGPGWYGPGWMGLGWYWDPAFGAYTFIPPNGIFYSPFGWSFYSPIYIYRSPYFYYPHYPHRFNNFHQPYGHGFPRGQGGFRRR